MSTTRERQRVLLELLAEAESSSQAELIEALADMGHPTTQPVISRDLQAVGAIKLAGKYSLAQTDRCTPLETLSPLLRDARPAGPHLAVIRCEPGAASAIARALEAEKNLDYVGTVAGDDTVLVAVESQSSARTVISRILELL
jgi:transcriptional regulator of arginine metabolism